MDELVPDRWRAVPGLICGFGSRHRSPKTCVQTRGLEVLTVRQVHGRTVVKCDDVDRSGPADRELEADGIIVVRPGCLAAIKTADCVPVLLVAAGPGDHARAVPRWAAALHAGWRGTVAGIVCAAVDAAARYGISPRSLQAVLGPSIGPCCYEVGAEVAERFTERGLAVGGDGRRATVDLRAANARLLEGVGLLPESISVCGPCTRCHNDRYYSFRADPAEAGRQLSWIGWAEPLG